LLDTSSEKLLAVGTADHERRTPPPPMERATKSAGLGGGDVAALTVTVASAVTGPPALTAVSVYVVLVLGCTRITLPCVIPMPWLMRTVSAPATFHDKTDAAPSTIVPADGRKLVMTGGGTVTVTVAEALSRPPPLTATSVYRVLDVGCTQMPVPLTPPMPGERTSESAPVTLQVRTALSPRAMVPGAAVKEATIGGAIDGSVRQAPRRSHKKPTALRGQDERRGPKWFTRGLTVTWVEASARWSRDNIERQVSPMQGIRRLGTRPVAGNLFPPFSRSSFALGSPERVVVAHPPTDVLSAARRQDLDYHA